MAIRVAQHYVQVVGQPTQSGELRVRRVYADVLVSGVSDSVLSESVNNTLTLTDSATRYFNSVENTLSLSQLVTHFNYVGDRQPVENVLNFTQAVLALQAAGVSNTLNFVQTADVQGPIKENVSSHLGFTQRVGGPVQVTATSDLSFSHVAGVPFVYAIADTLNFTQDSPIGLFTHTLNLTQNVAFGKSYTATNALDLTDTLARNVDYVRAISHVDFIAHSFTWYEESPCGKKQYTPFQGETTVSTDLTPPSATLQDPQGDTGNFSLYQPYLGVPTSEITLRKPEMDNRDRNAYTRINQETRGGKMVVYSDPDWPKTRTLAVTIVGLTETQVDDLQTFMYATLGQEIGLTDWEGRLWKGFITNPNDVATQDGRGRWTVTFEFEGEMLEVEQPAGADGDSLGLTQSVSAVIV